MAEGESSNIDHDGVSPEQAVSGQPPALTAARNSMWLFKSKFVRSMFVVALGALLCTAIYSLYIFTWHADPAEVFIFSAARYSPDKPFTLLVLARNAKAELPLQNQSIDLAMESNGKEFRKLPPVKTGADGIALVPVSPCPAGKYQIKATLRDLSAVSNIEVKSVYKSMVTSDKPMYQPGQTIHLRNLALNAIDLHPAPENDVNFKVHDPNGNLVFDQTAKSSAYGIASADFPLADQVKPGEYKIQASSEQTTAVRSITVKPYSPTECKITLDTNKTFYLPGDKVSGTVSIRDLYGKPLPSAQVTLNASVMVKVTETHRYGWYTDSIKIVPKAQQLTAVSGVSDAAGNLKFEFMIPKELEGINFQQEDTECKISVTAIFDAGQPQNLSRNLAVTAKPIRITFMPEFGQLLPGTHDKMYIFVSNPYDIPLESSLEIGGQALLTSKDGLALISLPPDGQTELTATDRAGYKARENINWGYNTSTDAFILKSEKAVVRAGEELQLEIVANHPGGRMFIYLVKDETPLEFIPVSMDTRQKQIKLKIPEDLSGTIQIHAYRLLSNGEATHELRLIQVMPEKQLAVIISSSQPQHRTGENGRINIQVKDQTGRLVQAALSIVAALDSKGGGPSHELAYFLFQNELLKPDCQPMAAVTPPLHEPVDRLTAGYMLANRRDFCNLQAKSCLKYTDRENALVQQKIKFGNELLLYLLPAILMLLAVCSIPLLLVALNTKNNSYRMVVRKEYPGEITRLLRKLQWMFFGAIIASAMSFIILRSLDQQQEYCWKIRFEHVLALSILSILLLLLAEFVRVRNRIFRYCSPDSGNNLQKIILLIPWFYGVFVFVLSIVILAAVFFPNTPGLGLIACIFSALALIQLFGLSGIQCSVCIQEYLDLYCNREVSNMGLGIGTYPRSFSSLWIVGSGLYIGPIIMTYLIIVIVIISLFLPLCKIVDKLGKGGDSSSSINLNRKPREEFFKPVPAGQYFALHGTLPCKEEPVAASPYFTETLYWQPELITDEHGRAVASFKFTGQPVQFRVIAIARDGAMGASTQELPSLTQGVK
ncbi:MAG: MG2 domain-containing protein [Victivallaceae bacterium]|jgi:hypothetical protein